VIHALDSLGHCDVEFSDASGRIFVAPPVMARLPHAGLPQAVLSGARTPATEKVLSECCKGFGHSVDITITEQVHDLMLVPARILIQAESVEQLNGIARSLGIAFEVHPPAWSLLHFSASLDGYVANCKWSAGSELNWRRRDFDPSSLQFGDNRQEGAPIRLSSYTDRVRNTQIYYLWQEESWVRVDRDWGRYVVLRELGLNILIYDQSRFIMAVPASAPLPRLLSRVLALCSGYACSFVSRERFPYPSPEKWGFNLFRDVPPQVAEMVAARLCQDLLPYPLNLNWRGNVA